MTGREKILRARNLVQSFFHGDNKKEVEWFAAKNPLLGNISPNDMIRQGRIDKLLLYIEGAIHESKRSR